MLYNINSKIQKGVIARALCAWALLFVFSAGAYASETAGASSSEPSRWLDDYKKPVGLTYSAQAKIQPSYLWRGLYCGALNIQGDASVGYGGLYLNMWWNIGTDDWTFKTFQPEVDFTLGFSRWGFNLYALYIHNFQHGFFDFHPYESGRNRLEVGLRYTVSSKLPLSFLWATRFTNADTYIENGDTIHAYSSYAEISYTQKFAYGLSLYGAVGITPWKSQYTHYKRGFAVQLVEIRLRKDWDVSEHCGLMLQGVVCVNPSALAADKSTYKWHPKDPGNQSINANIAFGVYLK